MTDKRYKLGMRVTVVYLLGLAVYAIVQRGPVFDMVPNEFGDFLAGVASPLAFLWLVLGYLQQGEELRQNTEALNLQVKELQASVDQQKALVAAAREQHDFELSRDKEQRRAAIRANQPLFRVEMRRGDLSGDLDNWGFYLDNAGRGCTDVTVHSKKFDVDHGCAESFDKNDTHWWNVGFPLSDTPESGELIISYTDFTGEQQTQLVRLYVNAVSTSASPRVVAERPRLVFPWESIALLEQPAL